MYEKILVPVDNSIYSQYAEEISVSLAGKTHGSITGLHVNSGRFHQARFSLLEEFLPDRYQNKTTLTYQRKIHSVLIGRGLEIIALEYLKGLQLRCDNQGIAFTEKLVDGKNASAIIDESKTHDLTIIGGQGLGEVAQGSRIGSNARRLLRHSVKDVLIAKQPWDCRSVLVGIDGSLYAEKALDAAVELALACESRLTIVSSFDPIFHQQAFSRLADVLSQETGKVFRFNEQQQLHTSVIDSSLEGLYQAHLEKARVKAEKKGLTVDIQLLRGKPYVALCQLIDKQHPGCVVVGRFGLHRGAYETIGSNAENLVELTKANILVVTVDDQSVPTPFDESRQVSGSVLPESGSVLWTDEAKARLERIPTFARSMAMLSIERFAKEQGIREITPEVMMKARERSL